MLPFVSLRTVVLGNLCRHANGHSDILGAELYLNCLQGSRHPRYQSLTQTAWQKHPTTRTTRKTEYGCG